MDTQPSEPGDMVKSTEQFFRRLFYFALALLPSIIGVATFRDHSLNVSLLFWLVELFLLLILGLANYEAKGRLARPSKAAVALSLVVLGTSLSAALLNAIDRSTAIGHLAITTTHFLFALAILSLFSDSWRSERRNLLFALMLSALFQVSTTFVLIGIAAGIPDFNWLYFHGGVGNVRQLGFVGITLVALSASLLTSSGFKEAGWPIWLALLIGMTFVNLIGGRAALLACMVAITTAVFLVDHGARLVWAAKFFVIWLISVPLSLIYVPPHEAWGLFRIFAASKRLATGEEFSSGRWFVWQRTVERITEHPFIGFGENQFVKEVHFSPMAFNHPHNFILQFLFQWGLIGTIAILTLAFLIIWRAFRAGGTQMDVMVPALALVTAMTVMAFLDGNFFYPQPTYITAIALGLLATVGRRKDSLRT